MSIFSSSYASAITIDQEEIRGLMDKISSVTSSKFTSVPQIEAITSEELHKIRFAESKFVFGEKNGNITINFPENLIFLDAQHIKKYECYNLLNYNRLLMQKYQVDKARIGYEPATDEDTLMVEMSLSESIELEEIVNKVQSRNSQ